MGKKVAFAEYLTIYEHPIEIGDNPACSAGAPIQIGWLSQRAVRRRLDIVESFRRKPCRGGKHLLMSAQSRCELLVRSGYSMEEVAEAASSALQARKQRVESLKKQRGWEHLSALMESTARVPIGMILATGNILASTGHSVKKIVVKSNNNPVSILVTPGNPVSFQALSA